MCSPGVCAAITMALVIGSSWWLLHGDSGMLSSSHSARSADNRAAAFRRILQPAHIGCPLSDRAASYPAGWRVAPDRRPDPTVLRIATFNAEWLFDGVDDSPKHVPWQGAAAGEAHLQKVAAVVASLDADILNVVEVEGCFMLHRLVEALPSVKQRRDYAPYLAPGQDSATRQQIGLVTKLSPTVPPQRTEAREGYPRAGSGCGWSEPLGSKTTGVSKHYWSVFAVPGLGKELLVVGAHLKARPNEPRSCAQREAQAAVLAEVVREQSHGRHIVLLGDLNDFDPGVPDSSRNAPTSNVLRQLSGDLGLVSAAARLEQPERWTWEGPDYPRGMLDHILVSEEHAYQPRHVFQLSEIYMLITGERGAHADAGGGRRDGRSRWS